MKNLDFQRNDTQYFGLNVIVGLTCLIVWIAFAWPISRGMQTEQVSEWPPSFIGACALLGIGVFFISQQKFKAHFTTSFTTRGIKQHFLWRCREIAWSDISEFEVFYEAGNPRLKPLQATFKSKDQKICVTLSFFKNPRELLAQIYDLVPVGALKQ